PSQRSRSRSKRSRLATSCACDHSEVSKTWCEPYGGARSSETENARHLAQAADRGGDEGSLPRPPGTEGLPTCPLDRSASRACGPVHAGSAEHAVEPGAPVLPAAIGRPIRPQCRNLRSDEAAGAAGIQQAVAAVVAGL